MFEKVNPSHPDKIADRIAGAIVDYAYNTKENPKVAVEVLIGHNKCRIINETDTHVPKKIIKKIVNRVIFNPQEEKQLKVKIDYIEVKQDSHLAKNQETEIRCGDNGIFKGCPITDQQRSLTKVVKNIWNEIKTDGKYLTYDSSQIRIILACQSYVKKDSSYHVISNNKKTLRKRLLTDYPINTFNPLGPWTGGINVDTGATNRKLGSDMGDAITGGGLHGKDLSKADVSVNIWCHVKAQLLNKEIKAICLIGDKIIKYYVSDSSQVNLIKYSEVVEVAKNYIKSIGGFEKLAEWGLIR